MREREGRIVSSKTPVLVLMDGAEKVEQRLYYIAGVRGGHMAF